MFQLNISLHNLSVSPAWTQHCHARVESRLRDTYTRWQRSHHLLTLEEAKHHEEYMRRQQGAFGHTLAEKLDRLVRTEEYVNTTNSFAVASGEVSSKEATSWWCKFLKYSLVSGVVVASMMSSSYLWSYNKCQQSYFSSVWPLLTFTSYGPRPF